MNPLRKWTMILRTLALGLVVLALPTLADKPKPSATIVSVVGQLEVRAANPGVWKLAMLGQLLYAEDKIRTGEFGKAVLKFLDGTEVRVAPNTELVIRRIDSTSSPAGSTLAARKAPPRGSLFMEGGDIWSKVAKKKEGDFTIETKTAVAAVKGTELGLQSNQDLTTLFVYEGSVNLQNQFGEILAQAKKQGEVVMSTATKDAAPTAPVTMKEPPKQEAAQAVEVKGSIKIEANKVAAVKEPFPVSVQAVDRAGKLEGGRTDKVTISSSSRTMLFSADRTNWAGNVAVALKGGIGSCFARDESLGAATINAISDQLSPGAVDVVLAPAQKAAGKELIVKIRDKDGKERTVILRYRK